MSEWRKIEDGAPKDGTRVWLRLETLGGYTPMIGHWDGRVWQIEPCGFWSSVSGWMPLPTSPKEGE